jgi:hypothetical protein
MDKYFRYYSDCNVNNKHICWEAQFWGLKNGQICTLFNSWPEFQTNPVFRIFCAFQKCFNTSEVVHLTVHYRAPQSMTLECRGVRD